MAIYHADIKAYGRGKGRSGSAHAAYCAGVRITDPHTGTTYDYRRRHGVEGATMLAPKDAPEWARDIAQVWARSDALATRKNARTAREVEVSLPHELTADQRHALALDLGQRCVDKWGVAALVAEHAPARGGDQRNHHVHIQLTPRVVTREGFGERAMTEFDGRNGAGPAAIEAWRADVADTINRHLERAGVSARVDHRTLADQARDALARGEVLKAGALARTPTQHEGKTNTAARRAGHLLGRAQANEATRADNVVSMRDWLAEHGPRAQPAARPAETQAARATAPAKPASVAVAKGGPAPKASGGSLAGALAFVRPSKSAPGAKAAAREWKKEAGRAAGEWAQMAGWIAAQTQIAREDLARLVAALRGSSGPTSGAPVTVRRPPPKQERDDVKQEKEKGPTLAMRLAKILPGSRLMIEDAGLAIAILARTENRDRQAVLADMRRYLEDGGKLEREELRRALSAWRQEFKPLERAMALGFKRAEAERAIAGAERRAWRLDDRRMNWQHRHPRPGALHPIARAQWDADDAQQQARIRAEKEKAEKARQGIPSRADIDSATRVATPHTQAADAALRRVALIIEGPRAEPAHAPAAPPLHPQPAPQPPPPEPERRRRRRRRPGGHGTDPAHADGAGGG